MGLKAPSHMVGTDDSDLELDLGRITATLYRSLAKPEDLEIPMYVIGAEATVIAMLPMGTDFADPEMLAAEAKSATQAFLVVDSGIYRLHLPTVLGG